MSPRHRRRTRYEPPGAREPRPWPLPPAAETLSKPEPERPSADTTAVAAPPAGGVAAPQAAETPSPAAFSGGRGDVEAPAARPTRWHDRLRGASIMAGIGVLAFATGLVLFNSVVMPRLIHGVSEVHVPDLRNLTLEQAEHALRPLDLQVSRAGERFDPAVPRGFILSQDPPGGTTVRGHKRISVMVSMGEEFSSVPELFGESQRSAEGLLKSAGLRLGAITRAASDDVGEGLVAGSDPGPETVLPRDTPVSLLVSTGSGEESFVMPDLLGREIMGVRRQLDALGFRVVTPIGAASIGTILSQNPAPGSRITSATVIQLQATGRMIR
ncbi:MAG: PASTA domain-containing protein [Candidatus Eisenbacteria bacterium]|uniref:PASTA domain-containing protein n=1 Tax=Eiseniibacteriota bacterium TaxID=2212470 RepID=A0A538TXC5_UNCEI|nr:MAG: PASTA domain-containing protein [Candidatus Eisenbacteria bacterium]